MVKERKPEDYRFQWALMRPLLWEKMPLFVLAALSSIVTFICQQKGGAVRSIEESPLGDRIANAFVSYILYARKTIWPNSLAVYYSHHGSWPLWQTLGAVLLLIAVTLTVIRAAKRFPYLAVGWLWFTGTLIPVIGIVQIGGQAMADRYTYIPLTGLFTMVAWGVPELLQKWRYRKEVLFASSALITLCLSIVAWTQVSYWRNSISLYDHTLEVTRHTDLIHYDRGVAYGKLGNNRQAIEDYNRAIEINHDYVKAYYNRGIAYLALGHDRQAISDFDRAVDIDPKYAEAYNNRGAAYGMIGNFGQAIEDFDKAIKINPKYADAYKNRGITYDKLGDHGQATEDMKTAARLDNEDAKNYLRSHGVNW
jgi:tetratricopeptide (TPR) repeat protein